MEERTKKSFIKYGLIFAVVSLVIGILLLIFSPFDYLLFTTSLVIMLLFAYIVKIFGVNFSFDPNSPLLIMMILSLLSNLIYSFLVGGIIGVVWSKEKSKLFKILVSFGVLIFFLLTLTIIILLLELGA